MSKRDVFGRYGVPRVQRRNGQLEFRLRNVVRFVRMVLHEAVSRTGLPWRTRFRAWRHGFTSGSWKLYGLDDKDPGLYLADFRAAANHYPVNGFYNPVLANKLLASRLFTTHEIPHPEVVSTVLDGRLFDEAGETPGDLRRALERTLERVPRQVFRPMLAGSGEGVFFLERTEDGWLLNDQRATPEDVCEVVSSLEAHVATAFVEQADYAKRIFPGSTNTLRVLTLWDEETGAPFVAAIVHRFGSKRSGPTDHWNKGYGGLCAGVNRESLVLGRAAWYEDDERISWTPVHPDSGEAIEGVAVPGLQEALDGVLAAAACFPYCPSIGWDLLMTPGGYCIIEANTTYGLVIMQVHEPLLEDPRTRAFYRRHGMA